VRGTSGRSPDRLRTLQLAIPARADKIAAKTQVEAREDGLAP